MSEAVGCSMRGSWWEVLGDVDKSTMLSVLCDTSNLPPDVHIFRPWELYIYDHVTSDDVPCRLLQHSGERQLIHD